ncbi:hypothetical protein SAMN05443428_1443 [Caloramator quimbayensis]|uniref:SurA N-terminal domain-containing protein n=1 Tax=Caloramator quimbayensis TaxID=1147123 RepID=A0A1T4YF85_9CLOT|nr:hypothetical protein [Caloramator quimbayensis]SKB00482.1 hypothetical protein SAMN05443428_1443 [Caloramator quimbayensis]
MKRKFIKTAVFFLMFAFILFSGGQVLASNLKTSKNNNKISIAKPKVRYEMNSQNFKEKLDSLVKSGTITQAQEDKILSLIKQKEDERKAEMEKVKNMTEEQRKEYFKQNRVKAKSDIFKELVEQNVITQKQADTIKNTIFDKNKDKRKNFKGENFKTFLDNQVKAGVITQDEENKIISYMNKKAEDKKAEMEKIKSLTEEERKAYFENKKSQAKSDFFKELVDKGILTQNKADVLKENMKNQIKSNKSDSERNKFKLKINK